MNEKYNEFFVKYNLPELADLYRREMMRAEEAPFSVGVFGEGAVVLKTLSEIFQLPELQNIEFPGEFQLELRYGDVFSCEIWEDGETRKVSYGDFAEKLRSDDILNELEDVVVRGVLYIPNQALEERHVWAATVSSLKEEDILHTDLCAVVLSATHLLSSKEKNLIKHPLNRNSCFFLCNLEKVHEADHDQIFSLMNPLLADGKSMWVLPYSGEPAEIIGSWQKTEDYQENRFSAIDRYMKPKLEDVMRSRLLALVDEQQRISNIVGRLTKAADSLPQYEAKTARFIYANYIEGIKTNTNSDILSFVNKMNADITEGVQEERNVKALQENLPLYIAGEWESFVYDVLNTKVQSNVEMVLPAMETYVEEKIVSFLGDFLSEETYQLILRKIYQSLGSSAVTDAQADGVSGTIPLDKKQNTSIRSAVSKLMMVFGGVAILSNVFVPGALVLLAGIKGNSQIVEEVQKELIDVGKKLNYDYYKEVQSDLDDLIDRIKVSTEVSLQECFSEVVAILEQTVLQYRQEIDEISRKGAEIESDLATL